MTTVKWPDGTDGLADEILTDACGDDEQLWAFRQAFEDNVHVPADAFVVGEPVEMLEIDYDGNTRRGLTARCRREDGREHVIAASDVSFPEGSVGARYVAAYRRWLGIEPPAPFQSTPAGRPKRHKAAIGDLDLGIPVELIVLAPKVQAARCRVLGTERELTLRSSDVWDMIAGEIVKVRARKQWRYAGHPYLSGDVESHRLDVRALGLQPLRLRDEWEWNPEEEYWGEEGEPLEEWARPIVARGPRPSFEMEQVLPGTDPDDWDSDPILEASERKAADDSVVAHTLLVEMLAADLRCLDAHAHLGNIAFEDHTEHAIRHYEVGLCIGELSLGESFDGVLPWGRVDNRPFLRCMHGYGLCLWRLGRVDEAALVFERMLWLNPSDNQGIRFLLPQVQAGERWEDHHGNQKR
jgi:hypothetical protein